MLILRIKQAESALRDGRLDEAYELVLPDDVRRHRHGQRLIGQLVLSYVERGRTHLQAKRFKLALADCDRAQRLGGNQQDLAELRAETVQQITAQQDRKRRQQQLMGEADRRIGQGQLSMGADLLSALDDSDDAADVLRHDLAQRRSAADAAWEQARSAMDRGDLDAAIGALIAAGEAKQAGSQLLELKTELTQAIVERVRNEIDRGRLDLAQALLDRFALLGDASLAITELDRVLRLCHQARARIQRGQSRQACGLIEQLAQVLPQAAWVSQALEHARQAAVACEALNASPLGLLASSAGVDTNQAAAAPLELDEVVDKPTGPPRVKVSSASVLPDRFLLQVDGAGSFLVIANSAVTIGPISSSRLCDVGLLASADLPVALIERLDEDYFLRSDGQVRVNDRPTTSCLLADGDKIVLGRRCTMKFRMPNAASTSALLDLSGAKLPRADVRKVILLDRSIIVGPGMGAHIRSDELERPAVLHVRDGHLLYKGDLEVKVGGKTLTSNEALPLNSPIRVGPLAMVMTPV